MNKRIITILSISAAVIILIAGAFFVYNSEIREITEDSTPFPMLSTPMSALSPDAPPIKGLSLANTLPVLEDNDFICVEKMETYNKIFFRTSCEQKTADFDMNVHLISSNKKDIILVEAQIKQINSPSDDQAVNFLSVVTELPVSGMDPDGVKLWIKTTLPFINKTPGMVVEKIINGIDFRVYGPSQNRTLEIVSHP